MEHLQRSYQVINEQMILFNEEYYLTVLRVPVDAYGQEARTRLFNLLYAFDSSDIAMEIDVSEEEQGVWYLQLLVPSMLTLPEMAVKRMKQGTEALEAYLLDNGGQLAADFLQGDAIYHYVKRYNPNLTII
ncbi:hypothetical protein G3578_16750 [Brevibacillus sp. SYP-B805]|uniref:hypothetical protein n=1 Tax=Brevibacillus sp. SYP-B805 TaxID=1578199 RepID=UPI0013E9B793|nr:hypothetical protein [Brevibacillus sp. SYP-B805]NGQ96816.1 hypothetical protein [Brevibacillus sp. SYP-B805]